MSTTKNPLSVWLENTANNAPAEFLRKAASQVLTTGYLSLGDFFDNTSDFELYAVVAVLHKAKFSESPEEQKACKATIEMLCDLICLGSGIENTKPEHKEEHCFNLALYLILESSNRKYKSDKEMRALRLEYSVEITPSIPK